jgi:NAD(P)-dependent dehydrogenase (short-subunit alcohol dehydrogenase family)
MTDPLNGRTALVTGGGSGIGANVARRLAEAGVEVWVAGRTATRVEHVAAEIGGHALTGDVSQEDDVADWFEEMGSIDLLVNNAGVSGPTVSFEQEDLESWWRVFEINVRGVFLCSRAATSGMLARGHGRIVNVASGAAYLPARRYAEYGLQTEQGSCAPLLGVACRTAQPAWRLRLLDQPRARPHGDDRIAPGRRCSVDAA